MSLNRYKSFLERKTRGATVSAIKGVPILLTPGENECEEDNDFIRWVLDHATLAALWLFGPAPLPLTFD